MVREHIHLIGIGGTGMTALAGLLSSSGCRVTGADRRLYPPTSEILQRLDLEVWEGFDPQRLQPGPDLVVIGNAVSRGNPEVEEVLDRGLEYTSMARLLGERFLRGRHSIVVAGTHGKTTTASMLAWVLASAGRDPGYLIGGWPLGFDDPFRIGSGPAFVVEGDEYDTAFFDKGPKFMHYRPTTALVGTVEFDHADIYDELAEIETSFRRFVNIVPRRGLLVRYEESAITRRVTADAHCRVEGYGLDEGTWRAVSIRHGRDGVAFDVVRDGVPFGSFESRLAGEHNLRNALAVIAAVYEQGLTAEEIATGLAGFQGVRRRLELRGEADGVRVFDDFAHHPTAIAETLTAVRAAAPGGRVWAVLEPRSWSLRRNVFQQRLVEAFDAADEVVIAAVFDAEAIPADRRLNPGQLAEELARRGRSAQHVPVTDDIIARVVGAAAPGDAVVIMSNGAFDGIHGRLLAALRSRHAAERSC